MNDFFGVLAILLMFFLFIGEPDVWDTLHSKALKIDTETCIKEKP